VALYASTETDVGFGGTGGASSGSAGGNGLAGVAFDVSAFVEGEQAP
jgi:hypothetical protein